MAVSGTESADRLDMLDTQHKSVLKILAQEESMPFLELSAVTEVDDERLNQIVDDLERDGFVEVTSRTDVLQEIVTVKRRLAALTASAR